MALALTSALALFAAESRAQSDSQPNLLGTIEIVDGFGADVPSSSITGVSLALGFIDFAHAGSLIGCIGCERSFPVGRVENVTIDFTRANSPGFDEFVSHLTNDEDEALGTQFNLVGLFGGGGSGEIRETTIFGRLLSEDQPIELVRLHVDFLDLEAGGLGWRGAAEGRWEIYSPIPEPTTAAMMLAGLALTAAIAIGARGRT